MSIVPLIPQDDGGVRILDQTGSSIYLPQLRIRGWVRLATQAAARQAIIDTGSPACIVEVLNGHSLQVQVSEDGQRWVALLAEP